MAGRARRRTPSGEAVRADFGAKAARDKRACFAERPRNPGGFRLGGELTEYPLIGPWPMGSSTSSARDFPRASPRQGLISGCRPRRGAAFLPLQGALSGSERGRRRLDGLHHAPPSASRREAAAAFGRGHGCRGPGARWPPGRRALRRSPGRLPTAGELAGVTAATSGSRCRRGSADRPHRLAASLPIDARSTVLQTASGVVDDCVSSTPPAGPFSLRTGSCAGPRGGAATPRNRRTGPLRASEG